MYYVGIYNYAGRSIGITTILYIFYTRHDNLWTFENDKYWGINKAYDYVIKYMSGSSLDLSRTGEKIVHKWKMKIRK